MRQFQTVVLERKRSFSEDFQTHPIETGWASEAMFFIRVEEVSGEQSRLDAVVQVSVDGIHWIDEGTAFPTLTATGDSFLRVSHFGGWLRLSIKISGREPVFKLLIHLVLKE